MTPKNTLRVVPLLLLSACASSQPPVDYQEIRPTYVEGQDIQVAPMYTGATGATRIHQSTTIRSPNTTSPTNNNIVTNQTSIPTTPTTSLLGTSVQSTSYHSFDDWKSDFMRRAIASGYNANDVQRLMAGAQMNNRVIAQDANQAEFVKMPWEYADSAVSSGRVSTGKRKYNANLSLFNRIQLQYGVDSEIVAAIWGMESSFGAVTGNSYLPSSLGSLAFEGRRREFSESQLLSLLQLLQRGDVYWSQLDGSWAGGMGQTQFIPATWLAQGVDGNGDGRRSPWTTADALSSTANYLSNSGWVSGLEPFYEVSLPANFNYSYLNAKQSGAQWQALGINSIDGTYLDTNTLFELWLPAGKDGPALLLSPNFDVIKVYNNSSSYALGVSLLGRAIAGQEGLQTAWPRYEQPLTTLQVKNLQQRLTSAGYDTNGVDGIIGRNTRNAFARWQLANGQIPDGFITQRSAQSLVW